MKTIYVIIETDGYDCYGCVRFMNKNAAEKYMSDTSNLMMPSNTFIYNEYVIYETYEEYLKDMED